MNTTVAHCGLVEGRPLTRTRSRSQPQPVFPFSRFLLVALIALPSGCGTNHHLDRMQDVVTPTPPPFLAGPAGNLLTNLNGFSARVALETPGARAKARAISGTLLGRNGQLLFAGAKETTFIWNVPASSGYLLNEPLQGYAPVTAPLSVTGLVITASASSSERVNGHSCDKAEMTASSRDGSVAKFEVWRAADLGGFAVRIKSADGPGQFTLNLTDVRQEIPAAALFLPPDGFTKYPSGDALMAELISREVTARGKAHTREDPNADPYAHGRRPGVD